MLSSAMVAAVFSAALAAPSAPEAAPVASAAVPARPAAEGPSPAHRADMLVADLLRPLDAREPSAEQRVELARLVARLGDEEWSVRDAASRELVRRGMCALPVLCDALENGDLEIATRARFCIDDIPDAALERIRAGLLGLVYGGSASREQKAVSELATIPDAAAQAIARVRQKAAELENSAPQAAKAEGRAASRSAEARATLVLRIANLRAAAVEAVNSELQREVAMLRHEAAERERAERERKAREEQERQAKAPAPAATAATAPAPAQPEAVVHEVVNDITIDNAMRADDEDVIVDVVMG